MGIYEEHIEGGEFDWFAIDRAGEIALFATAGEGSIPIAVINNHIEHSNISNTLNSPNWGSDKVWDDYAILGFYVFDWELHGGSYNRKSIPLSVITSELKSKIISITDIPKLDVIFSEINSVSQNKF